MGGTLTRQRLVEAHHSKIVIEVEQRESCLFSQVSSLIGPFTHPKHHFEKSQMLGTTVYTTAETHKKSCCMQLPECDFWLQCTMQLLPTFTHGRQDMFTRNGHSYKLNVCKTSRSEVEYVLDLGRQMQGKYLIKEIFRLHNLCTGHFPSISHVYLRVT